MAGTSWEMQESITDNGWQSSGHMNEKEFMQFCEIGIYCSHFTGGL